MKIITLTINPAYDIHLYIPDFRPGMENTVSSCRTEAGGKGINTSRALAANGIVSTAYFLAGRDNAEAFLKELDAAGLRYKYLLYDGVIRENITVHSGGAETRMSLQGGKIPEQAIESIFDMVGECVDGNTILTFAGRLPSEISREYIISRLASLVQSGVKIAVDSSSFDMSDISRIKPWFIKPNREEISALCGENLTAESDIISAARQIYESGTAHVLVTLGGEGAIYAGGEFCCRIIPPKISVRSTIGAGDSSIAGFCAAYSREKSLQECLINAAAYGSAACMRVGTLPPEPDAIADIYGKIRVEVF